VQTALGKRLPPSGAAATAGPPGRLWGGNPSGRRHVATSKHIIRKYVRIACAACFRSVPLLCWRVSARSIPVMRSRMARRPAITVQRSRRVTIPHRPHRRAIIRRPRHRRGIMRGRRGGIMRRRRPAIFPLLALTHRRTARRTAARRMSRSHALRCRGFRCRTIRPIASDVLRRPGRGGLSRARSQLSPRPPSTCRSAPLM
jgi:hypothetical protein